MTVSYTHEVADCRGFGNFWKLLFRWRGSVYKLVWPDLLAYTILYYTCSAVYRLMLNDDGKRMFEKVSLYCQYFSDLIPVSFVLGFYVSIVIGRWWDQYMSIPWPDSLALFVSTSIHGHDRQGRLIRRTILRYVNLAFVLTLSMITPRAKKRFPTIEHLVEAGLMTVNEKKVFENLMEKTPHPLYYLPLVWAGTLVSRARREGRIMDDFAVKTIVDELNTLRGRCGGLISYDWISIPLVYTQVVSLAVYTFFLSTIMGRQFLDPTQNYPNNSVDFYFPVFTLLQFFFYMGWLKVAESLVNPFGEDDDDFEVNWLIDRNIQVSYLIVDEMHNEHPELTQDLYWDEIFPQELPYTVAAEQFRRDPPMGSTANIQISEADQEFLPVLDEEPKVPRLDGKGIPLSFIKHQGSVRSIGSSVPSARKSSYLSMLQHRLMRGGELRNSVGSPAWVRRFHGRGGLSRSVSRTSGASSRPVRRNNTSVSLQDSDVFFLSEESVAQSVPGGGRREERPNLRPHYKQAAAQAHEDEGAILIKIKRRDKDGRELPASGEGTGDALEDLETVAHDGPAHSTCHSQPTTLLPQVSCGPEWDGGGEELCDLKSEGSRCSIRTSIFQDTDDPPPPPFSDRGGGSQTHQYVSQEDSHCQPLLTYMSSSSDQTHGVGDTVHVAQPLEEKNYHRVSWGLDKSRASGDDYTSHV